MHESSVQKTADIVGAVLSQLCLVHCLLLPFLVAALPALAFVEFLQGEGFHLFALSITTPVVLFALYHGYRMHGCRRPLVLGGAALTALWTVFALEEALPHDLAAAFNVMGGLVMAWAHWHNWSLAKVSNHCEVC